MIEDIFLAYADKGFVYGLAVYLIWKGHNQDKEYLLVLKSLKDEILACTKTTGCRGNNGKNI